MDVEALQASKFQLALSCRHLSQAVHAEALRARPLAAKLEVKQADVIDWHAMSVHMQPPANASDCWSELSGIQAALQQEISTLTAYHAQRLACMKALRAQALTAGHAEEVAAPPRCPTSSDASKDCAGAHAAPTAAPAASSATAAGPSLHVQASMLTQEVASVSLIGGHAATIGLQNTAGRKAASDGGAARWLSMEAASAGNHTVGSNMLRQTVTDAGAMPCHVFAMQAAPSTHKRSSLERRFGSNHVNGGGFKPLAEKAATDGGAAIWSSSRFGSDHDNSRAVEPLAEKAATDGGATIWSSLAAASGSVDAVSSKAVRQAVTGTALREVAHSDPNSSNVLLCLGGNPGDESAPALAIPKAATDSGLACSTGAPAWDSVHALEASCATTDSGAASSAALFGTGDGTARSRAAKHAPTGNGTARTPGSSADAWTMMQAKSDRGAAARPLAYAHALVDTTPAFTMACSLEADCSTPLLVAAAKRWWRKICRLLADAACGGGVCEEAAGPECTLPPCCDMR
eukprot:358486-Chlamydomonas_euryale.AAC.5